jgi:hypothetical protein
MACSLAIQNIVRSGNEPKELQAKLKETPPSKKEKANIDVISVSFWKQS